MHPVLLLVEAEHDDFNQCALIAQQFQTVPVLVRNWATLPPSQQDLGQCRLLILALPDCIVAGLSHISLSSNQDLESESPLMTWLTNHHHDFKPVINYVVVAAASNKQFALSICSRMQHFNATMLSSDILSFDEDLSAIAAPILISHARSIPAFDVQSSATSKKKPSRQALLAARKRVAARVASNRIDSNFSLIEGSAGAPPAPLLPFTTLSVINPQRSSSSPVPRHTLKVHSVRQLLKMPSDTRSTVLVVLDSGESPLHYPCAGNLGVHPRNDNDIVVQICARLGYDPELMVAVKHARPIPISSPCSVRDALAWHLDLSSPLRNPFIRCLAQYALDAADKDQMTMIGLPGGQHDCLERVVADQTTVLELLYMFPSVMVPLDVFIDRCPRLQPRFFTISSSPRVHQHQIHVVVGRTRTQKANGRVHYGVCSSYLSGVVPGQDLCHVFAQPSSFFVPKTRPVIMCATGAGLAPFRAFIQEAQHLYLHDNFRFPEWHLFFGCRRPDHDFLFEDEIMEARRLGVLTGLHMAFSRADPDRKVYIQDRIQDQHELIWRLIHTDNAIVFICGSTRMGKTVVTCLRDVIASKSDDDGDGYIQRLIGQGRLISELWGG